MDQNTFDAQWQRLLTLIHHVPRTLALEHKDRFTEWVAFLETLEIQINEKADIEFYMQNKPVCDAFHLTVKDIKDHPHRKAAIVALKDYMILLGNPDKVKSFICQQLYTTVQDIITKQRRLILIRGIPGCGKSTYARQLKLALECLQDIKVRICEADLHMGATYDKKS